jgi:transposase-like protein
VSELAESSQLDTPSLNEGTPDRNQGTPDPNQVMPDVNQTTPDLSAKQWAAVNLLAGGKSCLAVARELKIDPRTLYRWRQDERFAWELSRLRRAMWDDAAERLAAMVQPALDILEEQLRHPYERARYRAANAVLRYARLRSQTQTGEGA